MGLIIFIFWGIFSFIVAAIGSNRRIGGVPAMLLSIILSPLIGLIIVLLSETNESYNHKKKLLEAQEKQTELLRQIASGGKIDDLDFQQEKEDFQTAKISQNTKPNDWIAGLFILIALIIIIPLLVNKCSGY